MKRTRLIAVLGLSSFLAACGPPPDDGYSGPDVIVPCSEKAQNCQSISDCCGTLTCNAEIGTCTDGGCFHRGDRCAKNSDCCNALFCHGNWYCSDGSLSQKGEYCVTSSDCYGQLQCNANGICTDGFCFEAGSHCAFDNECCSGYCATSGVCQELN